MMISDQSQRCTRCTHDKVELMKTLVLAWVPLRGPYTLPSLNRWMLSPNKRGDKKYFNYSKTLTSGIISWKNI